MEERVESPYGVESGQGTRSAGLSAREAGPDPVIGAGIALFGIFIMGTAGARNMHYVFDAGMFTAVIGAVIFVLFVALSAMKQRRTQAPEGAPESS
jgi:hypothetical protein